jgi:general secretion pathway protein A
MIALSHAYGFTQEPFAQDVAVKDLYALPGLNQFLNRFDNAVAHNLSTVITGEVGAGKSTSLRAAASRMHPAQYTIIPIVATTGSSTELLKQICHAMGDPPLSNSIAKMYALVRSMLSDIVSKRQIPILMIDEAHLLRLEVLAQLHILGQVNFDSSSLVPIILSGQTALIDKLLFHTSKPFASRIVGRTHMESLQKEHMKAYLDHHLTVAGSSQSLFTDDAVTAIHQSSGGLLRRAGMLARGALLAAAQEKCPLVTGEHVRLAMTEIF